MQQELLIITGMESKCTGRGRQACPRVARVVTRGQSRWAGSTCSSRPFRWVATRAKELRSALLRWTEVHPSIRAMLASETSSVSQGALTTATGLATRLSQVRSLAQSVIDLHGRYHRLSPAVALSGSGGSGELFGWPSRASAAACHVCLGIATLASAEAESAEVAAREESHSQRRAWTAKAAEGGAKLARSWTKETVGWVQQIAEDAAQSHPRTVTSLWNSLRSLPSPWLFQSCHVSHRWFHLHHFVVVGRSARRYASRSRGVRRHAVRPEVPQQDHRGGVFQANRAAPRGVSVFGSAFCSGEAKQWERPPCVLGLARSDGGRHGLAPGRQGRTFCHQQWMQHHGPPERDGARWSLTRNCGSRPARCNTRAASSGCRSSHVPGLGHRGWVRVCHRGGSGGPLLLRATPSDCVLPVCSWCSLTILASIFAATTNTRHAERWSSTSLTSTRCW